jgi:hypothetical protein
MELEMILAVEAAIPPDHPASILAVPLGILFFVGSIYLLLWSNYGAKKALAITGVAWGGFAAILGIFWWFGAPGIPAGLGINHLPGQSPNHYVDDWYAFEAGSERAEFFPGISDVDAFGEPHEYLGIESQEEAERPDLEWTSLMSLAGEAGTRMQDQFLPIDDNGVAQIGAERRAAFEEEAMANEPAGAARRAPTFFTSDSVSEVMLRDDPERGVMLATAEFQAYANFVDEDGVPLDPVPVGDPVHWFAFYDPGAEWVPSAIWTAISLLIFLLSLAWLDRMEMREKRLQSDEVDEPERLAVPIAQ